MIPEWVETESKPRRIKSIDFSIMSPDDILRISATEVTTPQLYTGPLAPVPNGPLDAKLGVGTKFLRCDTCKEDLEHCVGHFGHSKLSLPIYHIGYFKHLIVALKMVCKYCYHVLLQPQVAAQYAHKMKRVEQNYIARAALFKKISQQASKTFKCPHCLKRNPVVQKMAKVAGKIEVRHSVLKSEMIEQKIKRGLLEGADRRSEDYIYELSPMQARKIITSVPREYHLLLNIAGNTHFENFIVDHLVIPPMCIRPSIALTNALSNEDDLSIKIKEIVGLNRKIYDTMIAKGDDLNKISKNWYIMQSHWSQYINADSPGLPLQELKHKSIRSFCTRLKGKQGRFRQNLSGKRSNYTARTVISPDPNLPPDVVIVPQFMCKILTIRETVNRHSIDQLKQCVARGSKKDGANYIITKGGQKIAIVAAKGKIQLRMGDIVERHLRDGDIVIFNRQPSLHRISMLGFKVKVSEGRTLRFNECVCTPFNADFDGDEMNIHVPQTLQARAETLHLMGVTQNLVTPKSGQPIIALIQDFLTTSFLLTSKDTFLTRQQFTAILSWFTDANELIDLPAPSILKPVCLWTGKQVISAVLRPNRLARVMVNFVTQEKMVYKGGECMGLQDGLVIFRNSQLLCGQIGKNTLGGNKSGLIYHLLRDNNSKVACEIMHRIAKLSSRWLSNQGMTIGISDVTASQALKQKNLTVIDKAHQQYRRFRELFHQGQLEAKPGMSVDETLESHLKTTLSAVREEVGKNCLAMLDRSNKPLIMSLCGSKGNPVNLSQMIGCLGQQTVSGKRIPFGFTERSLPHFPRLTQTPESRGFVNNSFYTGLTATQFFFHTMGGREGIIDTAVKTADTGYMQRRLIKLIEDISVMYDYTVRTCDRKEIVQFRYGDDGLDPMKTQENSNPVNLKHLEKYVKSLLGSNMKSQTYLTSQEIKQRAREQIDSIRVNKKIVGLDKDFEEVLLVKLQKYFDDKAQKLEEDYSRFHFKNNKEAQQYFRNCFNGMNDLQMHLFFTLYIERINRCIMEPGEAIGALTAQSIGEPATQMTLKTFHFAGIASMNITQGVPRVNQIINCTKNIQTPIITIRLEDSSREGAIKVKNAVQKLTLGKILHSIEEVYALAECSLNLILNRKMMTEFKITLTAQDIEKAILDNLKSKVKRCEKINANVINVIPLCKKSNLMFELKTLRRKLVDLRISGISTITRALISKEEKDNSKHIIFAEGLGLKQVLTCPGVDARRSFSNHITEVEEFLGIEASKQSIINQITETMRDHGVTVNPRHINLLSEVMTCKGKVIGFTRNHIDKMKDSTFMLASFEKTTDFLFDAATQGKHDRMRGVSQKIIMGQPITVGTGMFNVRQNLKKTTVYGNVD